MHAATQGPRRPIAFGCAGCDGTFCWGCETPLDSTVAEVKTIGSRYCWGCVDKEAAALGLTYEQINRRRAQREVDPCGHLLPNIEASA